MRWALWLCLLSCTADGRSDETDDPDSADTDPRAADGERAVIYQLVPRHFSNLENRRKRDGSVEENGVGKYEDIDETALGALSELGVTHLWLTGVLRQATLTDYGEVGLSPDDPDVVKGRAGSFYAVRDYFDTCPDYAVDPANRLDELVALFDRAHAADLRVLIDLVPNHVARGYGSAVRPDLDFGAGDDRTRFYAPDNHFFYLVDPPGQSLALQRPPGWSPDGVTFDGAFAPEDGSSVDRTPRATGNNVTSVTPSHTDWYETVKLNWGRDFTTGQGSFDPRPRTWTTMDAIIGYWQDLGVDGFRADFAHFVPNEAWSWLIARARERDPQVWFVAEAYEDLGGLQAAGFDAVYDDGSYDALKGLYQGRVTQAQVDEGYRQVGDDQRHRWLRYLENHDERRIASPLVVGDNPDDSGFGSAAAGRQLAPVQYLIGSGPVLVYNGQEVGEDGAGHEGFGGEDGRTTLFDYWSLPALQGWVNGHRYDGGGLDPDQADLRRWYGELLSGPVADPAVTGSGFWSLEYVNNASENPGFPDDLFTFARFAPGGGRMLVVVANFRPAGSSVGSVRLPADLLDAAGIVDPVRVRRVFDERGTVESAGVESSRFDLRQIGFEAEISDQATAVFEVVGR